MTDLKSDLVFIISLEAVFPTGDGVGPHTVSHREAVSCPHQYSGMGWSGEEGDSTEVVGVVLERTQPGVLIFYHLRTSYYSVECSLYPTVREVSKNSSW